MDHVDSVFHIDYTLNNHDCLYFPYQSLVWPTNVWKKFVSEPGPIYDENISDVKNFWQWNYVDKNYVDVISDIIFRSFFHFQTL